MSLPLYAAYAIAYLLVLTWSLALWLREPGWGRFFLILVIFGLFYDNACLALGNAIGEGPLLHALSLPRFWLHQLFLPWIMVSAFSQARSAGLGWARSDRWRLAVWIASAVVMALGILTRLNGLELRPQTMDGVLRYVATRSAGPPIVSIASIAFVGFVGFGIWRRTGWPWTWPVVILVFVIEGLPVEAVRRLFGSGAELALICALLAFERRSGGSRGGRRNGGT